jgi:hypothetical protein
MYFAIKAGSITNAQRVARALKSNGYKTTISRIENPQPNDGCGYVIKVLADDENKILSILQKSNIAYLGVEVL